MKVIDIVEQILRVSREARNSDKVLFLKFMEHFGIYLSPGQKNSFMNMPHLETVRRIRQRLQEQGKYLADQTIGDRRRFMGLSMQQREPKLKEDKIETVIEQHVLPWEETK